MSDLSDADRQKAAEIIETHMLADPFGDLRDDIATAISDERDRALNAVGRCGAESPRMGSLATSICALPAGHAGWHREGTTEWGIRRASEVTT